MADAPPPKKKIYDLKVVLPSLDKGSFWKTDSNNARCEAVVESSSEDAAMEEETLPELKFIECEEQSTNREIESVVSSSDLSTTTKAPEMSVTLPKAHIKLPNESNIENSSKIAKKKAHSLSKSDTDASKPCKPIPLINSSICRFCGKFYENADELKEHEIRHTVNKELLCPQCGMGFARRSYLVEHACIHSGEKPHKCYYCHRPFTLRCNLVRHVRIHTGEKPFVCSVCNKDFTLKKNMIEHKRTHTGEKPFSCKSCDHSFSRRSSLVRHLRIHTGEKKYECYTCHKKFSWKYYLQRHMAIHLRDKTRKRRQRSNVKTKKQDVIPQPETKFVNCNGHIPANLMEHSYAQIDETRFHIKEEVEVTEDPILKEEIHPIEETYVVPIKTEPPSPVVVEQKVLTVVVTPVITNSDSKADILIPDIQSNPIQIPIAPESNIVDSSTIASPTEKKNHNRQLRVKIHRLEDVPYIKLLEE